MPANASRWVTVVACVPIGIWGGFFGGYYGAAAVLATQDKLTPAYLQPALLAGAAGAVIGMILLPVIVWRRTRPMIVTSALLPPVGSKIRVESRNGHCTLVIPQGSTGVLRYLLAARMLGSLAVWAKS